MKYHSCCQRFTFFLPVILLSMCGDGHTSDDSQASVSNDSLRKANEERVRIAHRMDSVIFSVRLADFQLSKRDNTGQHEDMLIFTVKNHAPYLLKGFQASLVIVDPFDRSFSEPIEYWGDISTGDSIRVQYAITRQFNTLLNRYEPSSIDYKRYKVDDLTINVFVTNRRFDGAPAEYERDVPARWGNHGVSPRD